jgi:hypothetical protein
MVLCAALALMLQKEPVLTYETPAQTIEKVLLALSKQAGTPLLASTELRDEPLVVRFGAVPLSEAKARIAKVTSAEWQQLPQGGWRLTRTDAITQRLEREELQKRIQLLQPPLDKLRQELASEPPMNEERAKMFATKMAASWEAAQRDQFDHGSYMAALGSGPWSPHERALMQVLVALDPARLATIERASSRVFSNSPTEFQEELPQELCNEILGEYGRARNLIREELMKEGMDGDKYKENAYAAVLHVNNWHEAENPARLVLIVESDELGSLTAKLVGADDEGQEVFVESRRLVDNEPVYHDSPQLKARLTELNNHPGIEPGYFLTDLSGLLKDFQSKPDSARIAQRTLDRILDPEAYDPLAPIGELLIGWAELENKSLVAYPPDSFLGTSFALAQGKSVKIPLLVELMSTYWGETNLDDGWIEARPSFPLEALEERAPREALGMFLRRSAEEGFLSIENQVELAKACGPQKPMMSALVFLCVGRSQTSMADWDVLRLTATFEEPEMQALKVGTPLSSLPVVVQEAFLKVLLNKEGWGVERSSHGGPFGGTLLAEPTEFLAGAGGNYRLFLRQRTEPKFWLRYADESQLSHHQMMDLNSLAGMMYWEERQPGEYKCLAVAEMGVNKLALQASVNGRLKQFELQEFRTPTVLHPMDSLPDDLRAKLSAEMAVVAREHEKRMQGSP